MVFFSWFDHRIVLHVSAVINQNDNFKFQVFVVLHSSSLSRTHIVYGRAKGQYSTVCGLYDPRLSTSFQLIIRISAECWTWVHHLSRNFVDYLKETSLSLFGQRTVLLDWLNYNHEDGYTREVEITWIPLLILCTAYANISQGEGAVSAGILPKVFILALPRKNCRISAVPVFVPSQSAYFRSKQKVYSIEIYGALSPNSIWMYEQQFSNCDDLNIITCSIVPIADNEEHSVMIHQCCRVL